MVQLVLLDDKDEHVWDDLVASFETGTVFHTLAWMRVVEKLHHAEMMPFGIFDGSDLVGVFPLFRARRGPLTVLASPLGGVGYGGPLVDRSYYNAVIDQLDSVLTRYNTDYIEFRSLDSLASFADAGYTVREFHTIVVSLEQTLEQLWANAKGVCRTAVRRARKSDVEIVEAKDKSFLHVYYDMAVDTYAKSNRPPPHSREDYGAVWDILRPYGRLKVLLAQHEGRVIAGAIFLRFHDRLYYWDGAAYRAYYRLRPNNLLHWTLIEWGASNGLREYDMLGANIPSIARFKKSFGGDLRAYTYAHKETTVWARVGRRLYLRLVPQIRRFQDKIWLA